MRQAQGDTSGARAALTEAEQLVARGLITPTWLVPPIGVHRARLDLIQGDVQAARRWAEAAGMSAEDDPHPGKEFEYLTLARLLLAQGKPDAAQRLLTRLLAAAEAGGRAGRVIEMLVLQALALWACGQEMAALDALELALTLAAPEGYVRRFVDEGKPLAALLAQKAEHSVQNAPLLPYIRRILAAFPQAQTAVAHPQHGDATVPRTAFGGPSALLEPLSEREIEVLRLVASGLSDRAIAEKLILALGTVKKHLNNIYGKLGVHTRTQALASASALHLL
jgi:LuxR family maltose regulon positive regulatory protein